ncbi:hypothetical protein ANCCAN_09616 [Ancylostoma caninum]|uniref:Uncharacterized protein n=1 Tax=Ancylostoma caninum TaxID=29170 RepID=A0A368GJ54_ANCCA|nr:hypothetical protein ANCCAN_09616 [Ancylostoma caninum]
MNINKAQGQSLMGVGVYLGSEVFSHGQLYVALSRAKRRERVKLYSPEQEDKSTDCEEHDQKFSHATIFQQITAFEFLKT